MPTLSKVKPVSRCGWTVARCARRSRRCWRCRRAAWPRRTDLLCHRAGHPDGLIDQQNKGWNPVLDWAAERYGAPLAVVQGILPADHPAASLAAYHAVVSGFRPFSMTALHDLVTLSGSLVLALWVAGGAGSPDAAWALSRIDEDWQISQWGADEEATEAAEIKRAAFAHAARFLDLSDGN